MPVSQQPDTALQTRYLDAFRRVGRERAGDRGRNLLLEGVRTPVGLVRGVKSVELRRELRRLRDMLAAAARERRAAAAAAAAAATPQTVTEAPAAAGGQLESIALCESGGDPTAVGGGGLHRGKYQFTVSTWESVGGAGDPAAAPEAEQDRRAAMLLAQAGAGQWPVCGG